MRFLYMLSCFVPAECCQFFPTCLGRNYTCNLAYDKAKDGNPPCSSPTCKWSDCCELDLNELPPLAVCGEALPDPCPANLTMKEYYTICSDVICSVEDCCFDASTAAEPAAVAANTADSKPLPSSSTLHVAVEAAAQPAENVAASVPGEVWSQATCGAAAHVCPKGWTVKPAGVACLGTTRCSDVDCCQVCGEAVQDLCHRRDRTNTVEPRRVEMVWVIA